MRIAYICADLGIPVFGRKGCSIHVQEVVRALLARDARVELFTTRPEGQPPPGLEACHLHALPGPPPGNAAEREQAALAANAAVLKTLEEAGPFDMVYERYSLWSTAGIDYARARGIPALLEVNAPLIEEQATHRQLHDRAGAWRVAARVFAGATALLAVSHEVAAYLRGFAGTEGRVHLVPNGVDPVRFPEPLAPALPGPPGSFTVGFLGTLKPWHGLATLVEAFARLRQVHPESRLLIVGDGPERERLEDDLTHRGLRDAAFLSGGADPTMVPGLLASMDVAVAPYPALKRFYFSPLKVYEYMAAGRAVVASRIGQLAELIEHGRTGLLYPAGDAAALAEALAGLQREPGLRGRLGHAARNYVLRHCTWDAVAGRILGLAAARPDAHLLPSSPARPDKTRCLL